LQAGDTLKKFTVPVLWDTKHKTIVNNESSEIIRIFNSAFNAFATNPTLDLYPEALRQDIDAINAVVYDNINNGVYKCGFAQSQPAYNAAVESLYAALDQVEEVLSRQRYLVGSAFTEADVRLFMTLVRFDEVYVVYFKTNKKRIADYPHMHNYCRELYQMPAFRATIDMEHIKVRHVLPPSLPHRAAFRFLFTAPLLLPRPTTLPRTPSSTRSPSSLPARTLCTSSASPTTVRPSEGVVRDGPGRDPPNESSTTPLYNIQKNTPPFSN
jgi:hypothetical protein